MTRQRRTCDSTRKPDGHCRACANMKARARHAQRMADPEYRERRRAIAAARASQPEKREQDARTHRAGYERRRADPAHVQQQRAQQLAYRNADIELARARGRAYAKSPKGRASWMRTQYGMTMEQYAELLVAQGGHCALCSATQHSPTVARRLGVDHEHKGGRIRGLLCHACNVTLGLHGDTLEAFCDSAFATSIVISYLRGPGTNDVPNLIEWYRSGGPRNSMRLAIVRDAHPTTDRGRWPHAG